MFLLTEDFENAEWGHSSMLNFAEVLGAYGAVEVNEGKGVKLVETLSPPLNDPAAFIAKHSPVVYGGEIIVGKDGLVEGINNKCGHFEPEANDAEEPHLALIAGALGVPVKSRQPQAKGSNLAKMEAFNFYSYDGMLLIFADFVANRFSRSTVITGADDTQYDNDDMLYEEAWSNLAAAKQEFAIARLLRLSNLEREVKTHVPHRTRMYGRY